jgi:hypothetical protein
MGHFNTNQKSAKTHHAMTTTFSTFCHLEIAIKLNRDDRVDFEQFESMISVTVCFTDSGKLNL